MIIGQRAYEANSRVVKAADEMLSLVAGADRAVIRSVYGRTDDLRHEYNVTVSVGDPRKFRITGLANYELVEFNQAYHQGTGPTPGGTQTATNFDWGTKNAQTNTLFATHQSDVVEPREIVPAAKSTLISKTIGMRPRMVVTVVRNTGRKRCVAVRTTASSTARPRRR